MQLKVQNIQPSGTVVRFEGTLDRESVPQIRRKLLGFAGKRLKGQITFDLSGVVYMDTAGVALLVEAFKGLHRRGIHLQLVGLSENAKQLIYLARLEQFFGIEGGHQGPL